MNDSDWYDNPALKQIDPAKLQMLMALAEQAKGKNQADLLPFLLSAAGSGSAGMKFSQEETDAILQVMKIGRSPSEIRKIDRMSALMKQLQK